MRMFLGYDNILDGLTEISTSKNHFAKYVLVNTKGSYGNESNNSAE